VEGDDFYDRQQEIAAIWRYLDSNILFLPAPRRVGKTSLMKRLVVEAPTEGFQAGSIGLDTVTGRYNLGDTINDPQMMGLGPFAERLSENRSKSNRIMNRPGKIWALG
ncbi:MAG: hypothetical protein GY731_11605, partial [Gammaproteobacteria bacterium]|nr:hypothetical protein [Gammaproteobacteria bacterium]